MLSSLTVIKGEVEGLNLKKNMIFDRICPFGICLNQGRLVGRIKAVGVCARVGLTL